MEMDDENLKQEPSGLLPDDFNKSKFSISYPSVNSPLLKEIQNLSKSQCLGKEPWPNIEKVNAWMLSAETATFMKSGGLGVIASELPDAFNNEYNKKGEKVTIVTPIYTGNTGKKQAILNKNCYIGCEGKSIDIKKIASINVSFMDAKNKIKKHKVEVYTGKLDDSEYILLENEIFFSINPHKKNPPQQSACYVINEHNIGEVERFAFFSKAIYTLLRDICEFKIKKIAKPNILIANDWHVGAISGLTKYLTVAKTYNGDMSMSLSQEIKKIPVIHIAHHLGYQGWDYDNTSRILNSLYQNVSDLVLKNAKSIKNSNKRATNTLIVGDCYNQASCNFHLADRVVTVSKNYLEEVSKELKFGFDFRDILKIRKDHRNFFGIVNGYDKSKISPNERKIGTINKYFKDTNFVTFCKNSTELKQKNKQEFIKLISRIAKDKEYAKEVLPKIDLYKFADITDILKNNEDTPIISATSRLAEQKGYDIAVNAILSIIKHNQNVENPPIFILGGAGDIKYFKILKKLKNDVTKINPKYGKRIFVFHGYKDELAYSIQLASDFFMMPSKFEPCGLTQMEAMAKGAIPITTSTGGLVDTIDDNINGFRTKVFFLGRKRIFGANIDAQRLKNNINTYAEAMFLALKTFYNNKETHKKMQIEAMKKDFSWNIENGAIEKYYNLFHTGHI